MQISISSIFSAIFIFSRTTTASFSDGDCIWLETSCTYMTSDGVTEDCEKMKQQRQDECYYEGRKITVDARWCNYSGDSQKISSNSHLKLTGPASDAVHSPPSDPEPYLLHGIDESFLEEGKCQTMSWETEISDCEAYFNYEVHINPDDMCRGYFFEEQMKRLCFLDSEISCIVSGTDGSMQDCTEYNPCLDGSCDCANGGSCYRTVAYDFYYNNGNANAVRFDLDGEEYTKAKTQSEIVPYIFPEELPARQEGFDTFQNVKIVDYCKEGPQASINLRAKALNGKVGENASYADNYQYCWDYKEITYAPYEDFNGCPVTPSPTANPSPSPSAKPSPSPSRGPTMSPVVEIIPIPPSNPTTAKPSPSGKGKGKGGKGNNNNARNSRKKHR